MGPFSEADGEDLPGLVDEGVPGEAAVIEDVVIRFEDAVGEPVVADELPEVFDRIELWAPWRQGQERDVVGDRQLVGHVPAGLVEQEDGMGAGGDGPGDLDQVQAHALGGAARQNQAGALGLFRADGAVDVGRSGAPVLQGDGPGAALGPAPGDLVLLADPGLVLPPQLDLGPGRQPVPDRLELRREAFLKSSIAVSAWA